MQQLINNINILIFSPLIFSFLNQLIFNGNYWLLKKKYISAINIAFFAFYIFLTFLILSDLIGAGQISRNFGIDGILYNFDVDLFSTFFLIIIIFIKFLAIFYFKSDFEREFSSKLIFNLFSLSHLMIFCLISLFYSNNLLKIFIFLEVYYLLFLSFSNFSYDKKLIKINYNLFTYSSVSTVINLLILFLFYRIFNSFEIFEIKNNLHFLSYKDSYLAKIFLIFFSISIILKFFPIWIYFKKAKSIKFITNFFNFLILFANPTIGIYLLVKIIYYLFGNLIFFNNQDSNILLLFISLVIIFYSCLKMLTSKNLKVIISYLTLNNFGFILSAISLNNLNSVISIIYLTLNLSLVNLLLYFYICLFKKAYNSTSSEYLLKFFNNFKFLKYLLLLVLFFVLSLPFSFLYQAYKNLILISFTKSFEFFVIIAIFISILSKICVIYNNFKKYVLLEKISDQTKIDEKIFGKNNVFLKHLNKKISIIILSIILFLQIILVNYVYEIIYKISLNIESGIL